MILRTAVHSSLLVLATAGLVACAGSDDDTPPGPVQVGDDVAAPDALVGQPIRLIDGSGQRDAVALGIAEDGGLRVREDGHERTVHSGEVSVRPRP